MVVTRGRKSASQHGMKVLLVSALLFMASVFGLAGTPGSFRGTVVDGPEKSDTWMYVEGHNHSVRRVYVSGATIRYDSEVPAADRKTPVPRALQVGTQVRVTAEQDDAGEWRATDIEILKIGGAEDEKKKVGAPTTSQS
jgi:hypothetical protein